jgi:hypothetical protein
MTTSLGNGTDYRVAVQKASRWWVAMLLGICLTLVVDDWEMTRSPPPMLLAVMVAMLLAVMVAMLLAVMVAVMVARTQTMARTKNSGKMCH